MKPKILSQVILALLLALIVGACSAPPPEALEPQIVGGVEATPGEFPWMAQLRYLGPLPPGVRLDPDKHLCGGSLLEPSWVLTAAHCVDPLWGSPSDYQVTLGEHTRFATEGPEQVIAVAEILVHPSYTSTRFGSDIALLRLERPAELTARVATVALDALPPAGTDLTVSGWGRLSQGGPSSTTLQKVDVPLASSARCSAAYGGVASDQFCAGYDAGELDSCQGDSGGPIFRFDGRWEQVGIVSWGRGCALAGYYGVYTEVADHIDWIYGHVSSSRAIGWLWANRPNEPLNVSYTPSLGYQHVQRFNALPAADATVTRVGTGRYRATFPNLNVGGGTVHVSAYGGNHHCKVEGWSGGTDTNVTVRCFAPDGRPVNGHFTVLYYRDSETKSTSYGNAYLWAYTASAAPDAYQFNSRGATNTVRRLGTGRYEARLPDMHRHPSEAPKYGTVLVTAYGYDATRCTVGSWNPSGHDITARVNCFDASGAARDAQFTLSFMREPGRLAAVTPGPEERREAFYVWANASNPSSGYQSSSYGTGGSSRQRLGTGSYRVHIPQLEHVGSASVQVVAYGSSATHCTIRRWYRSATAGGSDVYVNCYDSSGTPTDAIFNLYYITDSPYFN